MILLTGATGFVGSHLLEKLRLRGEAVRCLVRPATDVRRLPGGVETAQADLATGQGLDCALAGVDTVIHVAGVTKALSPSGYFAGNAAPTEALVRAIAGQGFAGQGVASQGVSGRGVTGRPVRLVYVSSLAAIGPSPDGRPMDQGTTPHPVSTYGKSKLEGERIARSLVPDTVIVRPPVVYGPRDTGVFQILKAVSRGLVVEISGAGSAPFTWKTWPTAYGRPRVPPKPLAGPIFWPTAIRSAGRNWAPPRRKSWAAGHEESVCPWRPPMVSHF
jgi:dihydroflavonol-4-reductase